jgi:hypothetical protein
MKNWLRQKMHNFIFPSDEPQRAIKVSMGNSIVTAEPGESLSTEPLRLSVYRANGGTIIETRHYDRVKDRSMNQLHIVGHDQDLGHSIAKIITMESLRG